MASRLIVDNPDIFPGFSHINLTGNVLPKLTMLQEIGFCRQLETAPPTPDFFGAHIPGHAPHELATSARMLSMLPRLDGLDVHRPCLDDPLQPGFRASRRVQPRQEVLLVSCHADELATPAMASGAGFQLVANIIAEMLVSSAAEVKKMTAQNAPEADKHIAKISACHGSTECRGACSPKRHGSSLLCWYMCYAEFDNAPHRDWGIGTLGACVSRPRRARVQVPSGVPLAEWKTS